MNGLSLLGGKMDRINNLRARWVWLVAALAVGAVLASCATVPAAPTAAAGPARPAGTQAPGTDGTSTGRLIVTAVDQNGEPLARADVRLRSLGKVAYRANRMTDRDGRVQFIGVPEQIEVHVEVADGSYTDSLDVPQSGPAADIRITVQTTSDNGEIDITF